MTKKFQSAHPLFWGAVVSTMATLASYLLPVDYASTGVAFVFLGATYWLALPRDAPYPPTHYGLSLGGLMEDRPLRAKDLLRDVLVAFLQGTAVAMVVLPPFFFGFLLWNDPTTSFDWTRALSGGLDGSQHLLGEVALWHLLAVALPEEAFFRGYLQTSLDDRSERRLRIGRFSYGWSIVTVSVLFALGHLATSPHPARLAVFFPSLLFGGLRNTTGGIGAAVVLHAECNLFSQFLAQGYGS